MTVVFDGCRYVDYEFSQLDELELAYAMTVHKSQGSRVSCGDYAYDLGATGTWK